MTKLKKILLTSTTLIAITSSQLASAQCKEVQECVKDCMEVVNRADEVIQLQGKQIQQLSEANRKLFDNQEILEKKVEISNRWYMQPQNNIIFGLIAGFLLANQGGK